MKRMRLRSTVAAAGCAAMVLVVVMFVQGGCLSAAGNSSDSQRTEEVADQIDTAAGESLKAIGMLFGSSVILGAGALWGRWKPARLAADLIASVQAARQELKTAGQEATLAAVDKALSYAQTDATKAAVRKSKASRKLASVTEALEESIEES